MLPARLDDLFFGTKDEKQCLKLLKKSLKAARRFCEKHNLTLLVSLVSEMNMKSGQALPLLDLPNIHLADQLDLILHVFHKSSWKVDMDSDC